MKIESIIYNTCRNLSGVRDKMGIASLFIFCYQAGAEKLAELLYHPHPMTMVMDLEADYEKYDVKFELDWSRPEVKVAFYDTRDAVVKKYDKERFYNAVYEKDEYAMAIVAIIGEVDKMKNTYK